MSDTPLRVALVQAASGLDPAENRVSAAQLIEKAGRDSDLVVLPEVFARDFGKAGSDISAFAEPLDGPFVSTLTEAAAGNDVTIVAGMFEVADDPERPFNTLVVVDAGGLRASYRKIHLYDSFGYRESDRLSPGATTPVVVEVRGVRLGLLTCYDLRFPELARALVVEGEAQALVVPAAWVAGEGKAEHWRTLTSARAIENTVFVLAVGQPAPRYTGFSRIVDPSGVVSAEAGDGDEIVIGVVDPEAVVSARGTNPALANRRL